MQLCLLTPENDWTWLDILSPMALQSAKGNLTLYIHIAYWRHIHVQGQEFPSVSQQETSAPLSVRPRAVFCVVAVTWLCFQGRGRTWVQPVSAQCSRSLLVWKGPAPRLSLQLNLALFIPCISSGHLVSVDLSSHSHTTHRSEDLCHSGAKWTR